MPENIAQAQAAEQQNEEQEAQATSTEATATDQNGQEAAGDDSADSEQSQSTQDSAGSENASSPLWEGIPEDHPVRNEVRSLREESASRRKEVQREREAREALESKFKDAKTPEEFQAAVEDFTQKLQAAQGEALRERVGRQFGLPDVLVARLQGDDEAALTEDAKAMQALLKQPVPPAPKNPPSGGLTPGSQAEDPKALAARIRQRRR